MRVSLADTSKKIQHATRIKSCTAVRSKSSSSATEMTAAKAGVGGVVGSDVVVVDNVVMTVSKAVSGISVF